MKRWLFGLLSFLYFNALFTFENVPSSPAIRLVPKLSVEVLALVVILAAGARPSRLFRGMVALLLFAGALVRYVDTTAYGVLGREFDVYGDFPHLHRVLAMFFEVMTPGLGITVFAVLALVALLALALNWAALSALERALRDSPPRLAAGLAAGLGVLAFFFFPGRAFSFTVSSIVVRQAGHLMAGDAAKADIAAVEFPPQALESSLEKLEGAHVFLVFLESYGMTALEDAQHFDRLEPRYRLLETRLREGGYFFRSSQIQSPTFGGGSWRAHATLLSGFHADSEHRYNALLASGRTTLVHVLKQKGYRTVAAEPGIKWYWPDGLFYGFDRIYDFDALDYRGPAMGWWKIPDQFTLYRVYQDEIRSAEAPVFAKFSLIMTHIPYFPVPEYVPDWSRFDDGTAFAGELKSVAHDAYRDLMELSTWYVAAVSYELDVLEGFLLDYVPESSLVIIVGDHQPPKLATHDSDSWAVPMHVLSRRRELVAPFEALGFSETLVPLEASSLRMADFLESFLRIYDGRPAD
jgi:hypothetical protein